MSVSIPLFTCILHVRQQARGVFLDLPSQSTKFVDLGYFEVLAAQSELDSIENTR
jgi:hypothetical protein